MCLNETSTKVEISSLSFNSLVFTIDFSENMPYSITPVVLSSLFLQFNSPENESASRVFEDSEKETVDLQFNKENSFGKIEHDLF